MTVYAGVIILAFETLGLLTLMCIAALVITWTWFRLKTWRDEHRGT